MRHPGRPLPTPKPPPAGCSKLPFTSRFRPAGAGCPKAESGRSCKIAPADPNEQPAVIETAVGAATGRVVIKNVAVREPAGTATSAGTAAAGLLLVSATTTPP